MIPEEKQHHQTQCREHKEPCADGILFQEKRFDDAAPFVWNLLRREKIQNVAIHQLKRLTATSCDAGQWVLGNIDR